MTTIIHGWRGKVFEVSEIWEKKQKKAQNLKNREKIQNQPLAERTITTNDENGVFSFQAPLRFQPLATQELAGFLDFFFRFLSKKVIWFFRKVEFDRGLQSACSGNGGDESIRDEHRFDRDADGLLFHDHGRLLSRTRLLRSSWPHCQARGAQGGKKSALNDLL